MPKAFEAEKIDAAYADGILTVKVPKAEKALKSKVKVK